MKKMNYEEAVSYILEIPRFLAKNTTEDTKAFMKQMQAGNVTNGQNQKDCDATKANGSDAKIFHIAGTNGKGSVCAFMESVLRSMGKKTGLFTSPHLVDIRERIRIDGKMVSREEFLESFEYVMQQMDEFNEKKQGSYHPSFFEYLFFMAVHIFDKNNVDAAIYETGLGGRLDATNSLPRKDITVITQIGMDHMEQLGSTIESIAGEKAGIIMNNVPVVYLNDKDYSSVIEEKATECNSPMIGVGSNCKNRIRLRDLCIDFSYESVYYSSVNLSCHTVGLYQVCNANLALKALECVYKEEMKPKDMIAGIGGMYWPGRMEKVRENVYVDGGHNVDGVSAFLESVRHDGVSGRRFLVYSGVADKQIDKISKLLSESGLFEQIDVCSINSSRAVGSEELGTYFDNATCYRDVADAYEKIHDKMGDKDRMYICGSLYLVGEAIDYFGLREKMETL